VISTISALGGAELKSPPECISGSFKGSPFWLDSRTTYLISSIGVSLFGYASFSIRNYFGGGRLRSRSSSKGGNLSESTD
jgi:hypothetical protein